MRNLLLLLFIFCLNANATLIAHRGVHQTYDRKGLTNTTCTASRIDKLDHNFIENTIESIEEAFNLGAKIVELDVHPTTEGGSFSDKLAVFHDWTLNCRTNVSCKNDCNCNEKNECLTNEQSLSYIQSLDIGHGYTFDKGTTFPFRGSFYNKVPSINKVLELLRAYPNKEILVNVKGNVKRTAKAFLKTVKDYPIDIRRRLLYPYKYGDPQALKQLDIQDAIVQGDRECFKKYLLVGWYGAFPDECKNKRLFVPVRETFERVLGKPGKYVKFISVLWGWPDEFIKKAKENGTEVYASQVDSIAEFEDMKKLDLDGIMTNKIEIIGPYSTRN